MQVSLFPLSLPPLDDPLQRAPARALLLKGVDEWHVRASRVAPLIISVRFKTDVRVTCEVFAFFNVPVIKFICAKRTKARRMRVKYLQNGSLL